MRTMRLFRGIAVSGALAAIVACLAVPAGAQQQQQRPPQLAQGAVVFQGLDCTRCGPGSYCVVNPLRFEYACAPNGTYACAGVARTGWCPYGTTCWDGFCR